MHTAPYTPGKSAKGGERTLTLRPEANVPPPACGGSSILPFSDDVLLSASS